MRVFSRSSIASVALLIAVATARAQSPTEQPSLRTAHAPAEPQRAIWVASGMLLAGSLIFDERLRSISLANHSPTLDRFAAGADLLGTAGHIVPALVTTYVVTRVLGRRSLADATLRVGLSYAAADAVEALLKPAVGRGRPSGGHEPLTFRPFTTNGDFQSFPSAHVVHIASLATAVAMEADRPWVTTLAGVAISYVGAQRVYRDQHWSSDVVLSGMLGVEAARTTMHWLRARAAGPGR
jgi:membrane-associated phospholipid phosphatase